MSSPTDGYKLYNAEGQLIEEGTGHVQPREGESVVYIDDHASDPEVQAREEQMVAFDELLVISSVQERNYYAKYESAQAYLDYRAANPAPADTDPSTLIDPVMFTEIYDEFYYNYDLTSWNDIEFCQAIVDNHLQWLEDKKAANSMKEAKLRRKKLLAQQALGVSTIEFLAGAPPVSDPD